jgi:cysteinyl-tRNA synthetase
MKIHGGTSKLCINITDLDDKIIKQAKEQKKEIWEITHSNIFYFIGIYKLFNFLPITVAPTVTANMDHITTVIERLKRDGHLIWRDDSYRFVGNRELSAVYGALSKRDSVQCDFAVWKAEAESNFAWSSSKLNMGRPGWHTECVALIDRYCSKKLTIHCGGIDLIFPHHENELIQLKALGYETQNILFSYVGQLLFQGEKMSKSLNNTLEIDQMSSVYGQNAIKYYFLKTKYSSPIYMKSVDELALCQNEINKLLYTIRYGIASDNLYLGDAVEEAALASLSLEFVSALNDDLNSVEALRIFKNTVNAAKNEEDFKTSLIMSRVLGFDIERISTSQGTEILIGDLIEYMEQLREKREYSSSDALRTILQKVKIDIRNN